MKLDNYNLTASIHTVDIRSKNMPSIPQNINLKVLKSSYLQKSQQWSIRINPNKLEGDIFCCSEFYATMHKLTGQLQLPDYIYYRTDIRLDSYEDDFKAYYKLNQLLISLFSLLFHDTNGQAISHLLAGSKEFTDISTKNQYWEVKYYNKKFQTNDDDPAKARLEFRSLKSTNRSGYTPHEIKMKWFEKLDQLPKLYDDLQKLCNKMLFNAYQAYCNYNSKYQKKGDYATGFLSNYSNGMTIFTRNQLREFLQLCGLSEKTASNRTESIIERVYIEFFSRADLERYITKIKFAMDDYFDC